MNNSPVRTLAALLVTFVLLLRAGDVRAQGAAAPAPPAPPRTLNPTDKIPFDPAVTTGTLPNGLTYYIRRNTRPEKRVSLQLAVKAGSVDEADDQQGLAHFLEHMAFNGGRPFKPGEMISTFEGNRAAPRAPRH